MGSLVVTPWSDQAELFKIRDWLYPPNGKFVDTDLRRTACSQDSKYKISMFAKATELGFPASFVELRHEATHGSLPSLAVLRQAAVRALHWLWDAYWRDLDQGEKRDPTAPDLSPMLKDILRNHISRVMDYSKTLKTPHQRIQELPAQIATTTASQVFGACKGSKSALTRLVDLLGDVVEMTPSQTGFPHSMDEVFILWDELFQELAMQKSGFLQLLTMAMTARLVAPVNQLGHNDALRTHAYAWLEHIYTSIGWHKVIKCHGAAEKDIISTCLKEPSKWTISLASVITQCSSREPIREFFGPLIAEASKELTASERRLQGPHECADGESRSDFDGWQRTRAS
ncbi:MAG: hypothetical protein Q9208_000571 [Pyrenodesmia sp. 3 TL-2023]